MIRNLYLFLAKHPIAAVAATFVFLAFWLVIGEQAKPVKVAEEVGQTVGLSPEAQAVSVKTCYKDETKVSRVTSPLGQQYQATYNVEGKPRIDLTWWRGGSAVAVEETKGPGRQEVDLWTEELTSELWDCVAGKQVKEEVAPH